MRKYRWKRSRRWMENAVEDATNLIKEFKTKKHVFYCKTCLFCQRISPDFDLLIYSCEKCPCVAIGGHMCWKFYNYDGKAGEFCYPNSKRAKHIIRDLEKLVKIIRTEMRKQDAQKKTNSTCSS